MQKQMIKFNYQVNYLVFAAIIKTFSYNVTAIVLLNQKAAV